jgi:membrane protease YdiL (CAAX protease family)
MSDEPEIPNPPDTNWSVMPDQSTNITGWPRLQPPDDIPYFYRQGISPGVFVIICLAVVFVTYQIVGGLIEIAIFGFDLSPVHTTGFRVMTGLGQLALILVPTLILVRGVTFTPAIYMRVKAPKWLALLPALVGVFSLQAVLQVVQSLIDKIPMPDKLEKAIEPFKQLLEEAQKMLVSSNSVHELLFVLLIVAVIPALCEEMLFRGVIQRTLENTLGTWKGVIITGLLFGAYHFDPFDFIPLAAIGVFLGFLAMRADSLWMSASAHFFNNFLATIVVYFHLDDSATVAGNPDIMTGPQMAATFVMFGCIFAASVYLFLFLTKPQQVQTAT